MNTVTKDNLTVLDKPMWVFPGQRFRIVISQPEGSDDLTVDVPDSLTMFDHWPKGSIQRFYFRALSVGDVKLRFYGKAGGTSRQSRESLEINIEVIPWSDIFTPRTFNNIELPRIWPMDDLGYNELKTSLTIHTKAELKSKLGKEPDRQAKEWLSLTDEEIYNIVPGPEVPRTCLIVLGGFERAEGKGCPVCGTDIYEGRSGFYPWQFDPVGHPWKVGCPSCGNWFPSNDWANGDMHSGDFPDDGFGCEPVKPVLSPNGKPWRWPFIAYYHQWTAYMGQLTPGIQSCAEAFARTQNKDYAHKAAVGFFRLAESLLDFSLNLNHRKIAVRNGIYQPPIGAPVPITRLAGTFLYIQPNWDTPRFEGCAQAWELIFDQLDGDEELLDLCHKHFHPEIRTIEDFRRFVEAGLHRVVAQACMDDAVSRNYPMQESALATMALALNTPRSLELVDWLLNEGGEMRFGLTNEYFKDGAGHESEGYNGIQIKDMERLLLTLERIKKLNPDRYKPPRFISLLNDPKYKQMYDFPINDSLIGRIYPGEGDTGQPLTANPWPPNQTFPLSPSDYVNIYRLTRDERFAQVLYGPKGEIPANLEEPELRAKVEKIGKGPGWQVALKSNILDGFGHAILRSGKDERQRALWVRYGRVIQHAHSDMLTFGFEALQRRMLPELGYPQGWTYANSWEFNWGTHYGTHITGVSTSSFPRGRLTLFADTPPARVATAESIVRGEEGVVALKKRTIVLVDISDDDCYAISLEHVSGGKEHYWSFHGPDGEATCFGTTLTPRGGTALGEDVSYEEISSLSGKDSELAFMAFLYEPQIARPKSVWGIDYWLRNQDDMHLRVTMVYPNDAELTVAKGKAPGGKSEYEMTWAILQRNLGADSQSSAVLSSHYLCVLEPYEKRRLVQKIEPVNLTDNSGNVLSPPSLKGAGGISPPLAIRVTTDEYSDTIIFQDNASSAGKTEDGLACDGEFGFWRERNSKPVAAVIAHGTTLQKGDKKLSQTSAAYEGTIESCDFDAFEIKITLEPADVATLVGKHLRIHNNAGNNASYLIQAARPIEGGCILTLDLDPRIGEGFVGNFEDGCLVSKTNLRLARFGYYAGKTLANEKRTAFFRLHDVEGGVYCHIDEATHGEITAQELSTEFGSKDSDGLSRFILYDYGPGDSVTVNNIASLEP
ncbi:hypothetical protein FJZ31_09865 [Candidatus Poribacteria bacterium]|nr:hypothetical protein [Candidatus Poribacteria bacterium]